MVSFSKKLVDIIDNVTRNLPKQEKVDMVNNINRFYTKYDDYSKLSDKLPKVYNELNDNYKQYYNLLAAIENAELVKQNRPIQSFTDIIDYKLNMNKRPYNSLTNNELSNIYNKADELATKYYRKYFDNDYFDAVKYYQNELIYDKASKDLLKLQKEKELSKLSKKQLEDYATSEYDLPELKSSNNSVDLDDDSIYETITNEMNKYPQDSDIYNSLEAELINQQLADRFNTNYINQINELDNLLATGNFNYPYRSVYTKTGNELIDFLNEQDMMRVSKPRKIRDFSDEDIANFNKNTKIFPVYEDDGLEKNRGINTYLDILNNMRK